MIPIPSVFAVTLPVFKIWKIDIIFTCMPKFFIKYMYWQAANYHLNFEVFLVNFQNQKIVYNKVSHEKR